MRDVTVADPLRINYIVLDETAFAHAKADLSDLRLYSAQGEVPFVVRRLGGSPDRGFKDVTVVNTSESNGETHVVLDTADVAYDQVQLKMLARDFISSARVEGSQKLDDADWTLIGQTTMYDLSREQLGQNFRVPVSSPARYRYLRVSVARPVIEEQVTGASVALWQDGISVYRDIPGSPSFRVRGTKTIAEWEADLRVPVERITFRVDPAEAAFQRNVNVLCDGLHQESADITRFHIERNGKTIANEDLEVAVSTMNCKAIRVEIENEGGPELRGLAVQLQMAERRVYFAPGRQTRLTVYYGDPPLAAPAYEKSAVAQSLADTSAAAAAVLGPEQANAHYTGRPDTRPFQERHPFMIWAAFMAAVAGGTFWALKYAKHTQHSRHRR